MAQYLARVELIGDIGFGEDAGGPYSYLDECMASEGFANTVTGKKARQLPVGTYVGEFTVPTHEVAVKAIRGVKRSGKEGRVFVASMLDWAAKNLISLDGSATENAELA
jgi:hypothetical protein